MACCKVCCGCVDCAEGQEGKCCCGSGSTATCCQPGEYCCAGVCEPDPCGTCGCCIFQGEVVYNATDTTSCDEAGKVYLAFCEKAIYAADASECPSGYDFQDGACVKTTCIASCDSCVQEDGEPTLDILNCVIDNDEQHCAASIESVWHAECPDPVCFAWVKGPDGGTAGQQYYAETIDLSHCATPVTVTIVGSVDDDLVIDGSVIQAGEFAEPPFTPDNPAHAVDYTFQTSNASFTIAVKDNYGLNVSADLWICLNSDAPPP